MVSIDRFLKFSNILINEVICKSWLVNAKICMKQMVTLYVMIP